MNDINYTDNANLKDFTIEMETGTGKTFTYIKTMYELNIRIKDKEELDNVMKSIRKIHNVIDVKEEM